MAKEKPADTWGNQKASKFNQRSLERQRKKRMQELNDQNGSLREQVKDLQNQSLDLEDTIKVLIEDNQRLRDELTIARGKLLERAKDNVEEEQEDEPEDLDETTLADPEGSRDDNR